MRKVSSLAKAQNWPARALAGKPEEHRDGGHAKKHPPNPVALNFVITKRERLDMKKIKVHSLTGRITSELMRKAFQAVRRNRGAAGVDRVSIDMFDANLEENLAALMRELKSGEFRPLPLRRVH